MLWVAKVRVGGAGWASGVGDKEVSGISVEGEEDVGVEEVEGVCGPTGRIDRGSGIGGGGLGRVSVRGCKVGLVHLWTRDRCRSSLKQS
jgi:hypothetical protein